MGASLSRTVEASPASGDAVLVVLPMEDGIDGGLSAATPVAGLPLLRRIALAGARAGFSAVVLARPRPGDQALVAGTGATLHTPDMPARRGLCRVVLLPANVVPNPPSLRQLLDAPLEPETPYVDRSTAIVLDVHDPASVLALAARCGTSKELRAELARRFGALEMPLDAGGGFALGSGADVRAAETWLLRSLIKANEGFMSRNFERRVSLAITRRLVTTSVTPNAMTLFSVAIGIGAAPFFVSSAPAFQVVGALLFLTHSILDGCDGEIARLKFLESPIGAVLDFWGDNVVHAAIFSGIAIGWARSADSIWPAAIGVIAVVGTVVVASTVWRRRVLAWDFDEHPSLAARLVSIGVHRDFIYVILGLACFGKVGWFIVVTAIGAPLFLGVLVWASRGRSAA